MPSPPRWSLLSILFGLPPRIIGALLLTYWVALFVSTHVPLPERILETPGSDKVAHFLAYAGLGFLLGAWMWVLRLTSLKHFLMAFVGLMVWAAIDEWLQIPVNRSAEFLDWVADVLGAMSGLLCLRGLRGLASISSKPPPDLATETEVE